jgi:hypothetical protein
MTRLILHNRDRQDDFYAGVGKETSTVILEKPDVREIFQELRKQFTPSQMTIPKIVVNVGGAFCNKGDAFNKDLGRRLANTRVKPVEMRIEISEYQNHKEAIHLRLIGVDSELEVQYTLELKVYRDSKALRVMKAYTRSWR